MRSKVAETGAETYGYTFGYNRKQLRHSQRSTQGPSWIYSYGKNEQLQAARSINGGGFSSIAYGHDEAGNRGEYNPNGMNQYTAFAASDGSGFVIAGSVAPGATVTITIGDQVPFTITPDADGSFSHVVPPGSYASHLPTAVPIRVVGTLAGAGDNGADAVAELFRTGVVFPAQGGTFSHDVWGNRTSDPNWEYTWDGLGGLAKVETDPDRATAAGKKVEIESVYDESGRRIRKSVVHSNWDEQGQAWVEDTSLSETRKFIYDGWDLLAEEITTSSGTKRKFYTWGLDLEGTASGGGGTGGLLSIYDEETGTTYLPIYDGIGNVTALVDKATGQEVAQYDRGPFGEPLSAAVAGQEHCPFGFATHYTDSETGLVYFGKRWYDPQTGRFLSLEPLGEAGGPNLYAYCGSDSINKVDVLGLAEINPNVPSAYDILREIELIEYVLDLRNPNRTGPRFTYIDDGTGLKKIDTNRFNRKRLAPFLEEIKVSLIMKSAMGITGTVHSKRVLDRRFGKKSRFAEFRKHFFRPDWDTTGRIIADDNPGLEATYIFVNDYYLPVIDFMIPIGPPLLGPSKITAKSTMGVAGKELFRKPKSLRIAKWAGSGQLYQSSSKGARRLIRDLPKHHAERDALAQFLKTIRRNGGAVVHKSDGIASVMADEAGPFLFRWNPATLRIIDMMEEYRHVIDRQTLSSPTFRVTGHNPLTGQTKSLDNYNSYEYIAKMYLLNNAQIDKMAKRELLNDIVHIFEGTYK